MSDASIDIDTLAHGNNESQAAKDPVEIDQSKCTCPREVWLFHGCKCGAMKREKEKKSDDK